MRKIDEKIADMVLKEIANEEDLLKKMVKEFVDMRVEDTDKNKLFSDFTINNIVKRLKLKISE